MKNIIYYKIISLMVLVLMITHSYAQLSSNNAFLQGNFVEVGVAPCGSFGSSVVPPAGYHPRDPGHNNQLGFVADPAKDGWAVGTPNYVGDYFLPGNPEEGWGMTINGTSYNNNQICALTNIPGSIINYTNTATQVSATWQGTIAGLSITSKTYIPKNSVYFVTEVTVVNTSANNVNNVFFMRNVDPDHGTYTPGAGGTATTTNTIVNQNPNACNTALASSVVGGHYLGLGSIDSRARVTHGGFSNRSAINIWNGVGLKTSGVFTADEAISIAFNLGNLTPNQTVTFAYAYILSTADLTTALAATNTSFNVNNVNYTSGSSVNVCSGGATALSLSNIGTYSSWTWSPSTGLNTTSGTSVVATITSAQTYTATGTGPCGSVSISISLNPTTGLPVACAGPITGASTMSLGQASNTFTIAPVLNATTYNWVLPPGSVITSGANTNSITFNASNISWCGDITVTPANNCNAGCASQKAVCLGNILTTGPVESPLCVGTSLNITYSAVGVFNPGNTYTAQLSDALGSFASPTVIGSLTSNALSGSIPVTIPNAAASGSGYRIRVVSNNLTGVGSANGNNIQINAIETWYVDADNDNYYTGAGITQCGSPGADYKSTGLLGIDCNDNDASIHPDAVEVSCDGVDQNCNGMADEDPTLPSVMTQNVILNLDASGIGSITVADIDNGSSDNCGIASMTVFPNSFTCANTGENEVTLTITDVNGNISSATAIVTVMDNTPPTISAPENISINIPACQAANTIVVLGTPTVYDNCTVTVTNNAPATFPVGTTEVTWTAKDLSGFEAISLQTVTITQAAALALNAVKDINCTGPNSGSIVMNVTGGRAPYEYQLNNGVFQNSNTFTNLAPGVYGVAVRDADNCLATQNQLTLVEPFCLQATNDAFDNCAGNPITIEKSTLLGNDANPWNVAVYMDVAQPANGTVVDNGTSITYTPNAGFTGIEQFNYTIKKNDGTIAFAGNGHVYEWVPLYGITWNAARVSAGLRYYNGMQGYLVTVTSQAEMNFVASKLQGSGWMGASDRAFEGTWRWVTGPEGLEEFGQGRQFSGQNKYPSNYGDCAAGTASALMGQYANWAGGEPNDCGAYLNQYASNNVNRPGEHYAHFYGQGIWNDYPDNAGGNILGYIVEYGGLEGQVASTGTSTATITIDNKKVVIASAITNESCTNATDGSITLTVSGGTAPYTYSWSDGIATANRSGLTAGDYTVTTTDAKGCTATKTASILMIDNIAPLVNTQAVNAYLDANGIATIIAQDVNNGSTDNCGIATMTVSPNTFGCANTGANTATLTVTDVNGNISSAQAQVTVIDNIAPAIICPSNILVIATGASGAAVTFTTPSATDNCSATVTQIGGAVSGSTFPIGISTVIYRATDLSGNSVTCSFVIEVRGLPPVIVTPGNQTANNTQGLCSGPVTYAATETTAIPASVITYSHNPGSIFPVGTTTVTATATNAIGTSSTTFDVTVVDNEQAAVLTQNVTVALNAAGAASVTVAQVNNGSNDNCGIASTSVSPNTFTCANVGANTVVLTVTDIHGNISTANAIVTVKDLIAPTAIAQNVTVKLNANGTASVTAAQVNNGSTDNCAIATITVLPCTFTCANVGSNNPVVLTVTDVNGNVSTANAIVTVRDTIAPTVITQNKTVQLSATGTASITAAQINNGSTDNCAIATYAVSPSSFTCSNVGTNTVVLTVTDVNGNIATKTATVTVQDLIAPTPRTKNISVTLSNGMASITGAQVDSASSDNCGIASFSVSPNSFTCSNIGNNTVTLTVTDVNGNSSTKTAIVKVIGAIPTASIAQGVQPGFSQGGAVVLTASSPTGVSYNWTAGPATAINYVYASGTYSVTVTNQYGCTVNKSTVVTYTPSNLLSAYTIIGKDEVELEDHVKVYNGGVGVTSTCGEADIEDYSTVNATGTFVRAKDIDVSSSSAVTSKIFTAVPTSILPAFLTNPFCNGNNNNCRNSHHNSCGWDHNSNSRCNNYSSYGCSHSHHGSCTNNNNGSNNNKNVGQYTTVVIADSIMGTVVIGKYATVTFTSDDIYIKDLDIKEGATVNFTHCAVIRVCNNVKMDKNVSFNETSGFNVSIYVEKKFDVDEGAHVTSSVYSLDKITINGKSTAPTIMKGLFIGESVKAEDYVSFYWNTNTTCPAGYNKTEQLADENGLMKDYFEADVYPNPTVSSFNLRLFSSSVAAFSIEIYDMNGRLMDSKEINNATLNEELGQTYADGVYFIKVTQNDNTKTLKLIKATR